MLKKPDDRPNIQKENEEEPKRARCFEYPIGACSYDAKR